MGEGVVHVLRTHHVQLRVPDAVLFGKQEGEKLLRKKQKRVNDAEEPGAVVQLHTSHSPWQLLPRRWLFSKLSTD